MAYITHADLIERLGGATAVQLADDDGDAVADAGVLDEARQGAEGEVNSYLARRYQLPIDLTTHAEPADVLASMTLDLAEERLRARRPPVPAETVRRAAQTREWLARLAEGAIELPAVAALPASTLHGTIAKSFGENRLLSRKELADF